jgi:hypothetical protein
MPKIVLKTEIKAEKEIVFDLSRSISICVLFTKFGA